MYVLTLPQARKQRLPDFLFVNSLWGMTRALVVARLGF